MRGRIIRLILGLLAVALVSTVPTLLIFAADDALKPGGFRSYTEKFDGPNALVSFDMVAITGGKFVPAGSKQEVEVQDFYIGKTEMTWDVFDIFAYSLDMTKAERDKDDEWYGIEGGAGKARRLRPSKPYGAPDHGFGHQGFAALSMTYKSADRFCQWLSQKTGHKYRLPTEIEWEYAARAGGPAAPLDPELVEKVAWNLGNADDAMHPVATKEPNGWGLYDVLGNGVEWCTGTDGVPCTRGGSWKTKAKQMAAEGFALRQLPTESWNNDPQDPKSTWWYSDGKFVTFRVLREK